MTKFDTYKLIHVLAGTIWVGGAVASQVAALRLKSAEPGHRLGFARDMRFVAQWVFVPAAVVALAFGLLMVGDTPAFSFRQTWLIIGLAGLGIALAVAAAFLVPQIRKAVRLMESGQGPAAGAVLARVGWAARFNVVVLSVVVWAMVTKPGL